MNIWIHPYHTQVHFRFITLMSDIAMCELKLATDRSLEIVHFSHYDSPKQLSHAEYKPSCTASGATFDDLSLSLGVVHNTMHVSHVPRRRA
jgi:hypothetical protein